MAYRLSTELLTLESLFRNICVIKKCSASVTIRQGHPKFFSCASLDNTSLICGGKIKTYTLPIGSRIFCNLQNVSQPISEPVNQLCIQQKRNYAKRVISVKKPLSFSYSGDLVTKSPLDPNAALKDVEDFPELKSAPLSVQKLHSINFASGTDKTLYRKEVMQERIIKLFGLSAHREMRVAMLTIEIRNMIPHVLNDRKDKLNKSRLVEKIQMRKKVLKMLRREDYQRFLWLLQELRIRYVMPPEYSKRDTRRYKRKQEVWEAANNLRIKKLNELREALDKERELFLKYKEESLQQIEADITAFNLDRASFEEKLKRKRIGKIFPRIYTWEEREQMEKEAALK